MNTTAHQLNSTVQHSPPPCCNPRSTNHRANFPKPPTTKIALCETFKPHRRSRSHLALQIELQQNSSTTVSNRGQSTPPLLLVPINGVANHANTWKTIASTPCWKTQHPIREDEPDMPPTKKMNQICLCNQRSPETNNQLLPRCGGVVAAEREERKAEVRRRREKGRGATKKKRKRGSRN